MSRKPFMPNPGRIGVPVNVPIVGQQELVITLTVNESTGETKLQTNRPVSMLSVIVTLSGVIQNGAAIILGQAQKNGVPVTAAPTPEPEQTS